MMTWTVNSLLPRVFSGINMCNHGDMLDRLTVQYGLAACVMELFVALRSWGQYSRAVKTLTCSSNGSSRSSCALPFCGAGWKQCVNAFFFFSLLKF